jgi:catalase
VHSFTFNNAKSENALVKYKAIPDAGELGLSDDEAKAKGENFYADEMKDRLAKAPVSFELVAIRGKDGDPTNDPTLRWNNEDNRETTPLGKVSIDALAPSATCDAFSFLPGNVVDGIAGPANDPVFQARTPAYLLSLIKRQQQGK